MDKLPDSPDISPELLVCLNVLVLRESEGGNPLGLMKALVRQLERAIEKSNQGIPVEPIDTLPFAPPDDATTRARVQAGITLGMERIRRDAAKNPQRKAEYDALAARADGAVELSARQAAARRNLHKVVQHLLRGNVEALEAETDDA
jgi:hypothetical protein